MPFSRWPYGKSHSSDGEDLDARSRSPGRGDPPTRLCLPTAPGHLTKTKTCPRSNPADDSVPDECANHTSSQSQKNYTNPKKLTIPSGSADLGDFVRPNEIANPTEWPWPLA